jgi:hypothetical protein
MTAHHIVRHLPPIPDATAAAAREREGKEAEGMNARAARNGRYEIHVVGHLTPRWDALFDGMTITAHDDGTTVIEGPVADQSALHGLIRRLGDLGLPLVSLTPLDQPIAHPQPKKEHTS